MNRESSEGGGFSNVQNEVGISDSSPSMSSYEEELVVLTPRMSSKRESAFATNGKSRFKESSAVGWQSEKDLPARRLILSKALASLKKLKKLDSASAQRLSSMARKIEEQLYRSATTKQEYLDSTTLAIRLKKLISSLETKREEESMLIKESHKENGPQQLEVKTQARLDEAFNSGWRSAADEEDRQKMLGDIVKLITKFNPHVTIIARPNLPEMAAKLEEHLYLAAESKAEYADETTLPKRLQMVSDALKIYRRKQK